MDDDEQISGKTLALRFAGAFLFYFFVAYFLRSAGITSIWIHGLVLLVIYMLSTVSPQGIKTRIKKIWADRIAPLIKDNDNEQR